MSTETSLTNAYALEGVEGARQLYRAWADTYDAGFAEANGYRLHVAVAEAFANAGGRGPVLDVGAGTGLCGSVLRQMGFADLDALDLSPEMLAVANSKGIYQRLTAGDLLGGVAMSPDRYRGVVSSGTFTNGHIGPEGLDPLIAVALPGAQFALSINTRHFEAKGFAAALGARAPAITDLHLQEVAIYADSQSHDHASDRAFVALFRKA